MPAFILIFFVIAIFVLNHFTFEHKRKQRREYYRNEYLKSDAWQRKRYVVLKRDKMIATTKYTIKSLSYKIL